jgi:hypothetical protein
MATVPILAARAKARISRRLAKVLITALNRQEMVCIVMPGMATP